jgi:hypothetical protein
MTRDRNYYSLQRALRGIGYSAVQETGVLDADTWDAIWDVIEEAEALRPSKANADAAVAAEKFMRGIMRRE